MSGLLQKIAVASALSVCACTAPAAPSAEAVVAQRLAHYAELLRQQDASAIAAMFEPAGSVAHQGQEPVVGRAAIRALLESLAGYKVLSHQMQIISSAAQGQTVRQTGTYAQSVVIAGGGTVQVNGTFTALWRLDPGGQWLIESMRTAPQHGG